MPYSQADLPRDPSRERDLVSRWLPAFWLIAVALVVYFVIAHWHATPALHSSPDVLSSYVPERALWLEDTRLAAQGEAPDTLYRRHAAGSLVIPDAVWILTLLLYLIPVAYVLRRSFFKGDAPPAWNLALILAGPLLVVILGGVEDNTRASAALVFILGLTYGAIVGQRDMERLRFSPGDGIAWRNALAFSALVVGVLVAYQLLVHPDYPLRWPTPEKFARYAAWAVFQQWLLNRVLAREALLLTGGRQPIAAALVAALFGLLHAPNFALMCASCIGAFIWIQLYFRRPFVLPLAVSHVILSVALTALTPPWLVRNAEIGARFFMPAL
ncbi:hypothetical protein [Pseudofulvimonas gallinarii]|uniref:CAAX prenyl protease-like protein n=1 Tax=Pseudofulvimonas gallinarii TaxID=634155 RepID=A0A4R3LLL9_9GAMM|nr:hypothetical protein [Pseudofulvimonas gallinarii]TCT01192.1 hypothetical protein EDC25_10147 [Pseudofulvimonas gallinarii]THD14958.1 hypothetical protein B1808_00710 [Pseudofulvimonas gallinarii]